MSMNSTRWVLSHSLVQSLICSHLSLIRLTCTAHFARALRCAHSFARLLAHSLPSSWERGLSLKWMRRFHTIATHIHFIDKYVGSEWVGEWANKWAQQSTRAKRAVQSKRMNEHCEKTREQISKWPSTLRVKFHKLSTSCALVHSSTTLRVERLWNWRVENWAACSFAYNA